MIWFSVCWWIIYNINGYNQCLYVPISMMSLVEVGFTLNWIRWKIPFLLKNLGHYCWFAFLRVIIYRGLRFCCDGFLELLIVTLMPIGSLFMNEFFCISCSTLIIFPNIHLTHFSLRSSLISYGTHRFYRFLAWAVLSSKISTL